ncbi:MAG: D-alanyl-D-alanine carboxypeptidase, partial [Acidimicrobiales bacterium]
VLQHSDNLGAEMLVKELGLRFGAGGTTAAGVGVVKEHLRAVGVAPDGLAAADGSGLDRSDRLTCAVLQGVLSRSGEQGQLARALPVAGYTGTLAKRFIGTPAAGKVRAKTGSLEGVVGLGGWAAGSDGRALQFALLANEVPTARIGAALQDKVVSALARYPQAPPADVLAPREPGG